MRSTACFPSPLVLFVVAFPLLSALPVGSQGTIAAAAARSPAVPSPVAPQGLVAAPARTAAALVPASYLDIRSGHLDGPTATLLDGDVSTSLRGSSREELSLFVLVPYRMDIEAIEVYVPRSRKGRPAALSVWVGDTTAEMMQIAQGASTPGNEWTRIEVPQDAADSLLLALFLEPSRGKQDLGVAEVRLFARAFEQPWQIETYEEMFEEFLRIGARKRPRYRDWDGRFGRTMAQLRAYWQAHPADRVRLLAEVCDLLGTCGPVATDATAAASATEPRGGVRAKRARTTLHGYLLSTARRLYAGLSGFDPKEQEFKKLVASRSVAFGIRDGTPYHPTFHYDQANAAPRQVDSSCWFAKVDENPECWGSVRDPVGAAAYRWLLKGLEAIGEFGLLEALKKPEVVAENNHLAGGDKCMNVQGLTGRWKGKFSSPSGFPFYVDLKTVGTRFRGGWDVGNNHTFSVEGTVAANGTFTMTTRDTLPVPPFAEACRSYVRTTVTTQGRWGCRAGSGAATISWVSSPECAGIGSAPARLSMTRLSFR